MGRLFNNLPIGLSPFTIAITPDTWYIFPVMSLASTTHNFRKYFRGRIVKTINDCVQRCEHKPDRTREGSTATAKN